MSVLRFCALARRLTRILLLSCFAVVAIDTAGARPKAKKLAGTQVSVRVAAPEAPVSGPARTFSINRVLAKRDSGRPATGPLAAIDPTGTLSDAPPARAAMIEPTAEPFGLMTFRAPEGALWVKWRKAETEMRADRDAVAACRTSFEHCSPAARRLVELIEKAKSLTGRTRLGHINRDVNVAVRFVNDEVQHGVADLWTSPLTTLAAGRGDCEDYAIAKYFVLREAGIGEDDLQLLLVRDNVVRQDHATLAVRLDGRWLVLDNRSNLMVEPSELNSLTPLFTLDHRGVSMFAASYAAGPARVASPAR